ncbi:MAG: glutathione peroxidase [Flavobacteriales bacterium]
MSQNKTLYDFAVEDINGKPFSFAHLKGKKVLVVNTASECGYTSQYAGLEELYQNYKDSGLEIVAFPANDFGAQEPGDEEQIATFCQRNFGVTFPLMKKVVVLGKDAHEFYKWISSKELNGVDDVTITWNFQKLLFDEEGKFIRSVSPGTEPLSAEIVKWITQPQLF